MTQQELEELKKQVEEEEKYELRFPEGFGTTCKKKDLEKSCQELLDSGDILDVPDKKRIDNIFYRILEEIKYLKECTIYDREQKLILIKKLSDSLVNYIADNRIDYCLNRFSRKQPPNNVGLLFHFKNKENRI